MNPQIDLKPRLGKAKKMPKQPQFPGLRRGPPSQSLSPVPPQQFWLIFPAFHTFPGQLPATLRALPRTDQEMAHGCKFIILSHTPLTNGRGRRREAPPPRPGPLPRIPGIRGDSLGPRGARLRGGLRRGERGRCGRTSKAGSGTSMSAAPAAAAGPSRRAAGTAPARERRFPAPRRAEGGGAAAVI